MKRPELRTILFAVVIAGASTVASPVSAQSRPDSSMMQPVQRWIDAYNSGTPPLPEDIFTDDVAITDEFPPYVWVGKAAEHQWALAINGFMRPGGQHVSVGAAQWFQASRDGTRVSFVLPATLTLTSRQTPKTKTQHALWLFVLVRNADGWKIAADTWTTVADASPAALNIPLIDERGVLLLKATLDGAGPMLFTFDPGARDLYTSYARRRLNAHAPQTVCISGACFAAGMEYFQGDPLNLYPQHDIRLGAIAGSIGRHMLEHYAARIDYRSSTLTLIAPAQFHPTAGTKRLTVSFDSYGMPAVTAAIDGKRALFEVDPRAPTSMLFSPFLARTDLNRRYARTPVVKQSQTRRAHAVHAVVLSGVAVYDIPFWFATDKRGKFAAADVGGLLGNNLLSHFVLTFDLPHRSVYLRKNSR